MSSNIRITRVCQYCGDSFIAKTTVTKFCGDNCSKKAYKLRNKEEKVIHSHNETALAINQSWHNANQKGFLNVKETCILMGVSRTTLWRLVKSESLDVKEIGRKRIFRKTDIDSFMNQYIQNHESYQSHLKYRNLLAQLYL